MRRSITKRLGRRPPTRWRGCRLRGGWYWWPSWGWTLGSGSVGGGSGNLTCDTNLTGPNDNAQGVTLAASTGDTFGFDALTTGGSGPASIDISVGGTQVVSVAYLDRYNGKPFSFTQAGVAHTGAFTATVNF